MSKKHYEEVQDAWSEGYSQGYSNASDYYKIVMANPVHSPPPKWLEVSVDPKGAGHTYKLRVPGGWLFRTVTYRWPEYHRNAEEGFDWTPTGEPWTTKTENMAMEILTQTTVFVPEGA